MGLKLTGLVMVAVFCAMCGILMVCRMRSAVSQCEGFRQLIDTLSRRIDCYRSPLDEIYRDFRNRELEGCGFLPLLREHGMCYALENCTGLHLSREVIELLMRFGESLGETGREEQLSHCAYYGGELTRLTGELRSRMPQRSRLYMTLSVAAGLMLDLLLL